MGRGNSLYKTTLYPRSSEKHQFNNVVYLGIGGNIGDTKRLFDKLFWFLKRDRVVDIIETSPILKNPPFGYLDQSDFYNAVIKVSTFLTPQRLLNYILRVEKRFGRKRSFKDAPRTLDIDMIFYNDRVINSKSLMLPHPHWHKRDSVLIPLSMMKGDR